MAYDPGALETVLAAAVGAESTLVDELRWAFLESAQVRYSALCAADQTNDWVAAAVRLKSLAASFGALRLLDAANFALAAAPGNRQAIVRIDRALSALCPELPD